MSYKPVLSEQELISQTMTPTNAIKLVSRPKII